MCIDLKLRLCQRRGVGSVLRRATASLKDAERLEFSESDQVLFESLEDLKREYKLVSEFYEEKVAQTMATQWSWKFRTKS